MDTKQPLIADWHIDDRRPELWQRLKKHPGRKYTKQELVVLCNYSPIGLPKEMWSLVRKKIDNDLLALHNDGKVHSEINTASKHKERLYWVAGSIKKDTVE